LSHLTGDVKGRWLGSFASAEAGAARSEASAKKSALRQAQDEKPGVRIQEPGDGDGARRKAYGVRCKEEEVRSQESEASGQRATGRNREEKNLWRSV